MRRQTLIIIPGFLTESHHSMPYHADSPLSQYDPTAHLDYRAWQRDLTGLCQQNVHVHTVHWNSQSPLKLAGHGLKAILDYIKQPKGLPHKLLAITQELHLTWSKAISESDHVFSEVCELVQKQSKTSEVILLGHSLGGRIALKALNHLAKHEQTVQLPKVCAWAPAISIKDLDWLLLDALHTPPEICYSQEDRILKYLFPLGQGEPIKGNILDLITILQALHFHKDSQRVLGYSGPPQSVSKVHKLSKDYTQSNMTHLSYLPKANMLFEQSSYLSKLLK